MLKLESLQVGGIIMQNATKIMKKTKDEVQTEAKNVLSLHNNIGLVAMATGTGKSKIAVDKIAEFQSVDPDIRALIIVPTEKLRDENWRDEFLKWNQDFLWNNNVERSCYASINKIEGEIFDIVILDECHNITPNNSRFFENNTVKSVIGLTATPPTDKIKQTILQQIGLDIVYRVTLDEAVSWGLVAPYKITVIKTSLDSSKRRIKFGKALLTELSAYMLFTKFIDDFDVETATTKDYIKKELFIRMRMHLIYGLESKATAAHFLLNKIIPEEQRTLIFAGNKKQAESMCEHFFHSSSSSENYNRFKRGEINRLASVRALNEGDNIDNLDNALIIQINSKELDLVQRVGRIVRYREDHLANIYILVARNTMDEVWLMKAMSSFEKERIEYINFSTLQMSYD